VPAIKELVRALRTDHETMATADAPQGGEDQLRLSGYPLRVVAPQTVQRAAFEKDRGPDARAIVDGEALDVEDGAGVICDP